MIALDGYTDIERIGRGGLGDVYRATRASTGATVAVKVLRDVSDESVAWHRTRRELTALVSLAGHANVVRLIEVLDLPDGPALVMEYAPGGSVAELMLRRDRPLTVGETVLVGRQTAAALVAAHAQGIVHRDVKPQNLLIDAYGQVKLCDFGIAAMARSEEFRARTSAVSMRYASPEDLDDDIEVGPPSDVYSLGATMLHMARGAPPTLRERLAPWEPPVTEDAELAALDGVVASCLRPAPDERPTAPDLVDELERLAWSIDERNRSLAFASAGDERDADDLEVRDAGAAVGGDEMSTASVHDVAARAASDDPTMVRAPVMRSVPGDVGTGNTDDDTVDRVDRRAPVPPRPRSRRRWTVAGVVVLAVVAAVIVGAWWRRGASDSAGVLMVERPSGLTPITELDWPLGEVGECLAQVGDVMVATSCDDPHDLQRIAVGTLDPAEFGVDAAFDPEAVQATVRATCAAAVADVDASVDDLDTPFSTPSAESWDREGDRTYQCFVGVDGRRLVGDVAQG